MKTNVVVQREVKDKLDDGDEICLQQVIYSYGPNSSDEGIRFIRRDQQGRMKAQRGQANIVSLATIKKLVAKAEKVFSI